MATKLISGALREVWRADVPLAGGLFETVTTGIRCSPAKLSQVQAILTIDVSVNTPAIASAYTSIGGYLVVLILNSATADDSITWTLDVTLNHSIQQAPGAAAAPVTIVAGAAGQIVNRYTEGIYTPIVTLVGAGTVPEYASNVGRYTRIGDRCFVDIWLDGPAGSAGAGAGVLNLSLPIPANVDQVGDFIIAGHFHNGALEHVNFVQIAGGASVAELFIQVTATQTRAATGADQDNAGNRSIKCNFNYKV
jgi:hypothetical protein